MPTTTRLTLIATVLLLLAALPACNTMEGAGKDIETAGEVIQEEAKDSSN